MFRNKLELLKKENNAAEMDLDYDVEKKLAEMAVYVHAKGIGAYEAQVFRRDMISMARDAEARGQSFEGCLGMDPFEFCDCVVESSRRDTAEIVIRILYRTSGLLLLVAVLDFFRYPGGPLPVTLLTLISMPICIVFLSAITLFEPIFYLRFSGIKRRIPNILLAVGLFSYSSLRTLGGPVGRFEPVAHINIAFWVLAHLAAFVIMRLLWSWHINRKTPRRYDVPN